ncbi:MAG: hypothetical protein J5803_00575 [Desulfovibrio sp.]|nr:hypothetical protein [Desulfovibrio sp.]
MEGWLLVGMTGNAVRNTMNERSFKMAYVTVQNFLCDAEGVCYGILAKRWPNNETITVVMDMETKKSSNPRRPSFEDLRFNQQKQRRDPLHHKLLPGGMLRLRLFDTSVSPDTKSTDWPNVLAWSEEEASRRMRFGRGFVKLFTPYEVKAKKKWFETDHKGIALLDRFQKEHKELSREEALESLLWESMPGCERYRAHYYLYDPEKSIRGCSGNEAVVRTALLQFFSEEEFAPYILDDAGYRPVKPHLLVRLLDDAGNLLSVKQFLPGDAEVCEKDSAGKLLHKRFLEPYACVEKVCALLGNAKAWDILPAHIYPGSMEKMKMGEEQNRYAIAQARSMSLCGLSKKEDGRYQHLVRTMGLALASGGSCVVINSFFDRDSHPCDPALLQSTGAQYDEPTAHECDGQMNKALCEMEEESAVRGPSPV